MLQNLTSSLDVRYVKEVRNSHYMEHSFITKGGKLMPLVRTREKAQIVFPSKIRETLGIKKGDYLEAEDNKIVLIRKVLADKPQICYFIQEGRGNAQRSFRGRQKRQGQTAKNIKELIHDLHK